MRRLTLALLLALAPACPSTAPAPAAGAAAGLPDHDPALARKLAAEGALVVDVRSPEEFASGHADRAINIPIDQVDARLADFGADKSKPIVVYCAKGGRAAAAKEKLVAAGYSQVTNLGGLDDWKR